MLLLNQGVQVLVTDDLLAVETAHLAIPAPESIEVIAENGRVQKSVLAENVHRLILDRGAAQDQLVPCPVP